MTDDWKVKALQAVREDTLLMNAPTFSYDGELRELADLLAGERNYKGLEQVEKSELVKEIRSFAEDMTPPDRKVAIKMLVEHWGADVAGEICQKITQFKALVDESPNTKNMLEAKPKKAMGEDVVRKAAAPHVQETHEDHVFSLPAGEEHISKAVAEQYVKSIQQSITRGFGEKLTPFLEGGGAHSVQAVVEASPKALFELMQTTSDGRRSALDKIIRHPVFRAQVIKQEAVDRVGDKEVKPADYLAEALFVQKASAKNYAAFDTIFNDDLLKQQLLAARPDVFHKAAKKGAKLEALFADTDVWNAVKAQLNPPTDSAKHPDTLLKTYMDSNAKNPVLNGEELQQLKHTLAVNHRAEAKTQVKKTGAFRTI